MNYPVRLVVALDSEAKPICSYFSLKLYNTEKVYFKIFHNINFNIWLVVSGVGNINAAIASTFLYFISNAPRWCLWLNVGTAGHYNKEIGDLYEIGKVSSNYDIRNVYFTGSVVDSKIPKADLITVNEEEKEFICKNSLYDMEALGFIKTVEKFTIRELICIIKVVSDNKTSKTKENFSKISNSVIKKNLDAISFRISQHKCISMLEYKRLSKKFDMDKVKNNFRFSFSEKKQLVRLLEKWSYCYPEKKIEKLFIRYKDPKSLIEFLKSELSHFELIV